MHQVYALGHDEHWLEAVSAAADETIEVHPVYLCEKDLHTDGLPDPVPEALLLLDATRQRQIQIVAEMLGQKGWRHIVIVAADQNWKEAKALIKDGIAYDYWPKSYELGVIRQHVRDCLQEMMEDAR
jgi:hypothetical protein